MHNMIENTIGKSLTYEPKIPYLARKETAHVAWFLAQPSNLLICWDTHVCESSKTNSSL